ncbi:hypothetical protein C0585_02045 [Candidatus Woesearchaeota archaeon]|nr:MAG: hypothetical protein C0585_02045 [Candidatus Woesearchaeota archaeon]
MNYISESEAKKYLETLKPGYAGYLHDGKISKKDILATLMDLIVRGYIGIDYEYDGNTHKINKIWPKSKKKNLLEFEQRFLNNLFDKKEELELEEIKRRFQGNRLTIPLKYYSEITNIRIIKKRYQVTGPGYKEYYYGDMHFSNREKEIPTSSKIAYYIVGFFMIFAAVNIDKEMNYFIATPILTTLLLFISLYALLKYKLIKVNVEFDLETQEMKKKYDELFHFLREHPLKKQRIFNEFMPFAVAFGLDTSWNKSFNIKADELVIPDNNI